MYIGNNCKHVAGQPMQLFQQHSLKAVLLFMIYKVSEKPSAEQQSAHVT